MRRATLAAAAVILACAQYGAPPGGVRDQVAPQVIATVPEPFAVVPDMQGPVVIRFDERLSERGAGNAVLVSPQTGEVTVERDGEELRISIEGGWRAGQIYRIVVLPELRDLFGNQRTEPADLVFSTGPPIPATALAGIVLERITGNPPERAVVQAVRRVDSTVYVTPASTDGFFALLNLPTGMYDVIGFTDGNQSWELDPSEQRSAPLQVTLLADTITAELAVMLPDTLPARLQSAVQQGAAIRVLFDDYVVAEGITAASARLYTLPDTVDTGIALEVLTPAQHALRFPRPVPARADTAPAVPDSLALQPDTTEVEPVEAPDTAAGEPLPTRELFVLPQELPAPGDYLVELQGVVNINGLEGGGGTAPVTIAPIPPPDTSVVPADTAQRVIPLDTMRQRVVPVDTMPRVVPDTVPLTLPVDSAGLPPDTTPPPLRRRP